MLKHFILSKKRIKKATLAFTLFASLTGLGLSCGKRKPPLPPVEKVQQRVEISGVQRGNTVILKWILPDKNASDKSLLNINRIDIYRLAEPLTARMTLSEEEFTSRGTVISTISVSNEDFTQKEIVFTDSLEFTNQPARLRYAVRFVNSSGQKAAFSNFLLVEPTPKVARNPSFLTAEIFENKIGLSWKSPVENVDGSTPANIIGYNIYRTSDGNSEAKVLNDVPVTSKNFNDMSFEFGEKYIYFVRTISLGTDGEIVESNNSNKIETAPVDTFKPDLPGSLTIAAAPNNLSIFFAFNAEKDVVGYKIYRTIDKSQPKSEWLLLNEKLLTTNTFQDTNVEPGRTYYYYLIAVDGVGNKSEPSEIVSETAL